MEPDPEILSRERLPHRVRTWLPCETGSVNRAVQLVQRVIRRCGGSEGIQTDLEIVVREAVANAIEHGGSLNGKVGLFLRCYGGPGEIWIVVRDHGPGFDPDSVPDPRSQDRRLLNHGRGLLLMRELTDSLWYRHDGREVVLYRKM